MLAIFVSAMIGGGIIFIDDKARGLHEGYLVTPIRKFELILGFNLAGRGQGGARRPGHGHLSARSSPASPTRSISLRLLQMLVLVVVTALALISMMFLLVVRVNDPLVPRAMFGVLNTHAVFPQRRGVPDQRLSRAGCRSSLTVDPFTYAVHGFKELLLKNTGLAAIGFDLAYSGGLHGAGDGRGHAALSPHLVMPGGSRKPHADRMR